MLKCMHEELPNRNCIRMNGGKNIHQNIKREQNKFLTFFVAKGDILWRDNVWLPITVGTDVYDKIVAICRKTQMLNDICCLISLQVWICFVSLNYLLSIFRHELAIAHFNENVKREAEKTKEGMPFFSIHYPKYKNGDKLAGTIHPPSTYNCVDNIRNLLLERHHSKYGTKNYWTFEKWSCKSLTSQFRDKMHRLTAIEALMQNTRCNSRIMPQL